MNSTPAITFASEQRVTQPEFARWLIDRPANDLNRYELLEGRIIMNSPAAWPEGEGEGEAFALLRHHVRNHRLGRVFGPSQGFELITGDIVGPDASFVSRERWDSGPRPEPGKFLKLVPELVVEVLSREHPERDRVQKRIIYARAGVREYWIIDLRRGEVTVYHAVAEGQFDGGRVFGRAEVVRSTVILDLEIAVKDLLVEA